MPRPVPGQQYSRLTKLFRHSYGPSVRGRGIVYPIHNENLWGYSDLNHLWRISVCVSPTDTTTLYHVGGGCASRQGSEYSSFNLLGPKICKSLGLRGKVIANRR